MRYTVHTVTLMVLVLLDGIERAWVDCETRHGVPEWKVDELPVGKSDVLADVDEDILDGAVHEQYDCKRYEVLDAVYDVDEGTDIEDEDC